MASSYSRRQAQIAADQAAAARANARAQEAAVKDSQAKAAAEAARAESAKAQVALAETARKASQDAAARDPAVMATKLVTNAGGPIAGMIAGAKLAKVIGENHVARVTRENVQIKALSTEATRILSKSRGQPNALQTARLRSISNVAGKMKLGKPGPLGLGYAAVLAAEGAYTRFVLADQVDNPAAKEAVRATGNAFAFAATTLVAKRALARATTAALPSATGMATIETARRISTTPAMRGALAVGRFAARALPVIGAGIAAYGAYQGYKKAGVKGAIVGAVTGGYVPNAMVSGQGRVQSARLALVRSAAARTAVANRPTLALRQAGARSQAAATVRRSDGTTSGYMRRNGVSVNPYPTPKRRR